MDNQVTIVYISNPFDPVASRRIEQADVAGQTVGDVVRSRYPDADPNLTFTAAVNGNLIGDDWDRVLAPGDSLTYCATPGRTSSGKNVFAVVAMVAVMVAAPQIGSWAATAYFGGSKTASILIQAGVSALGGYLISQAFPPKLPSYDGVGSDFEQSQTYGWLPDQNAYEPGRALPVLYGKHRVVPPMLSRYVETGSNDKQYLNMLFAVAGHPIDTMFVDGQEEAAIYGIEINDQPIEVYGDDILIETRPGFLNQTPIDIFEDQRSDTAIGAEFSTDWTVRQISGEVDKFGVGLVAPGGLFYANDQGGLDLVSLVIQMQYRAVGDETWQPWVSYDDYEGPYDVAYQHSDTDFSILDLDLVTYDGGINLTRSGTTITPSNAVIRSWPGGAEHPIETISTKYDTETSGPYGTNISFTWYTHITVSGPALPENMTSFEIKYPYTVSGSQSSAKRWFFTARNPYAGRTQYEYRFRFLESPPEGSRYAADLQVEYHQTVISEAFEHPYIALLAIRALATDELSGGQVRVSCMAERMTAPVLVSDDPEVPAVEKPVDNPAWAAYHALTDDLNGGGIPPSRMDYDVFDAWADNCTANNLTCNVYFDDMISLKRAIDTIGMTGRGQVVQMGSRFIPITDFEDTAVQRFSFGMGNIEAESFSEEWLPMTDRADEIEVTYWDADKKYERRQVSVQQEGYETLGRIPNKQSIPFYGCTDRQMAVRYAKFLLNRNRMLTLTASWSADVDAIGCMPNDVIDVSHDVPRWGESGRITEVIDASTLRIDRDVELESGKDYVIDIRLSDDSRQVATFTATANETTDIIDLTSALDPVPEKYDNYAFGEIGQQHKSFRVVEITRDGDLRRRLSAIEYVPEIYNDDATVPDAEEDPEDVISGLAAREVWASSSDGSGRSTIEVTWRNRYSGLTRGFGRRPYILSRSSVYMRPLGGWWRRLVTTYNSAYTVSSPLVPGTQYDIAVSPAGRPPGAGQQESVVIQGKPYEPDPVYNITAVPTGDGIRVSWDEVADVDRMEYVVVRGASYDTGDEVGRAPRSPVTDSLPITPGSYQYWVAAVDQSGNISETPESASVTVTGPSEPNPSYNISGEVVQIKWPSAAETFAVDYYLVDGDTQVDGRMYSDRVNWTGVRTYTVQAVDIAGNEGPVGSIGIEVIEPGAPYSLTTQGHPYEIRLTIQYNRGDTFAALEIWQALENSRNDVSFERIAETGGNSHVVSGVGLEETRYYWVRTRDIYDNHSDWYPAGATDGVPGSASSDPSDYLDILTGSITEEELFSGLRDRIDKIDTDFVFEDPVFDDEMFSGLDGMFSGLYANSQRIRLEITDLEQATDSNLSAIHALESEIAGLITTDWEEDSGWDEGRLVRHEGQVWRCLQTHTAPSPAPGTAPEYWEESDALSVLVSNLEVRVDYVEGELTTKASQVEVDGLDGRVGANETAITQNAEEIALKASQTDLDQFSALVIPLFDADVQYETGDYVRSGGTAYRAIQDIDFTPAPQPTNTDYWEAVGSISKEVSTARSEISVTSNNVSIISESITGPLAFEDEVFDEVFVEWAGDIDDVDVRLSRAVIGVDGANSRINLLVEDLDTVEGRLATAETTLDANVDDTQSNAEALTTLSAELDAESYTRAQAISSVRTYADSESAVASWRNTVEAEHGNNLAGITENATAITTLEGEVGAEYSLFLNVNNRISGFRAMLSEGEPSEFDIVSDRFRIVNHTDDGDIKVPFVVGSVAGESQVGIDGDLIIDGKILARHLSVDSLSAITANLGEIEAGLLQSQNWGTAAGVKIDLNNEIIQVGGSDSPSLSWDGISSSFAGDITEAKAGGYTLISGGYINTNILTADNIKTGILSAGLVRIESGDGNTYFDGNTINVYDENNKLRVKLGAL